MGQYHEVINADKKMCYSARSLGDGIKLLEQGNSLASATALALLLSNGWNGERVFLLGDYAELGDINGVDEDTFYEDVRTFRNVGWLARKVVSRMHLALSSSRSTTPSRILMVLSQSTTTMRWNFLILCPLMTTL